MSTQSVKATVSNGKMARTFTDTATDGVVFLTNNLLDDNSSQNIGILIPGQTIDQIQMTYTGGLAQWRIFDSVSQAVSRTGFCSKVGYVCPMEAKIQPYVLKKTDLLQVFPKAVNATSNDSEVMAWLHTTGQQAQSFQCTTAEDATATAMTNSITGQSLGDGMFGRTLTRIQIQSEDGSNINAVQVIDQTGSVVWSSYGGYRLPTAGGKSTTMNLDIPCGLQVQKGWAIKVLATTA